MSFESTPVAFLNFWIASNNLVPRAVKDLRRLNGLRFFTGGVSGRDAALTEAQ